MFGRVDYGRGFVGDLVRYAEMLSFMNRILVGDLDI